ncbi:FmdB family zinc ribbon protein [Microbacterium sp. NPDC058342]|uniref:FmdB family zinc ribbon protein n=1 Tax=Microbacterium sp. NPDC058342 TaxID=3346454 RepID=UPI0036483BEA
MPTYAYACTACEHRFDAVQSFSEDSLTICPECGGALRKQYGAVGVTFNGSGFYRTDSRGDAGAKAGTSASSKADSSTGSNPAPAKAATSS